MSARILMTGSRDWVNQQASEDALNAAVNLLGAHAKETSLVHGAAAGADSLLASIATRFGISTEAHPAKWQIHEPDCSPAERARPSCVRAGHIRNEEMIALGADVCLAFPTHGYLLAPGEDRKLTSRGTWSCADKAKAAGIPVLVVWGRDLYPFGHPAMELLKRDADRKGLALGAAGQIPIVEAWLPF